MISLEVNGFVRHMVVSICVEAWYYVGYNPSCWRVGLPDKGVLPFCVTIPAEFLQGTAGSDRNPQCNSRGLFGGYQ